ncbi:MAG TPA: cytochrome c [Nitrospira sp.]|nr:cytochrome c [Nitrospira sp.]
MERTRSIWTWRIVGGMLAGLIVGIGMAAAGDPAAGEKVYKKYKCSACHMINGKGSKKADDLSHVGANRDAEWLKTYMVDPKSKFPKSKHPKWKGNDKELDDLVAYMGSLK